MARVKLSGMFTRISGRLGGSVFRNWKGITVMSNLPDSVAQHDSPQQAKYREILAYCSKQWQQLGAADRNVWLSTADYLTEQWDPASNPVGENNVIRLPRGPYTGIAAMVSAHSLLASVDAWDTTMADVDPTIGGRAPSQPTGLALSGDTAGLIVDWTDPALWGEMCTAGYVRVWVVSTDLTYFTQLAAFEVATTETTTITELRISGSGGVEPLAECAYLVQVDAVNAEGYRSAPSAVEYIRLAAPAP